MTTTVELLSEAEHIVATEIRKQQCADLLADVAAARRDGATDQDIRDALKLLYGEVYTTSEMTAEFEAIGFAAPYVVVRRRSDGVKGSLQFIADPRTYYAFEPAESRR